MLTTVLMTGLFYFDTFPKHLIPHKFMFQALQMFGFDKYYFCLAIETMYKKAKCSIQMQTQVHLHGLI